MKFQQIPQTFRRNNSGTVPACSPDDPSQLDEICLFMHSPLWNPFTSRDKPTESNTSMKSNLLYAIVRLIAQLSSKISYPAWLVAISKYMFVLLCNTMWTRQLWNIMQWYYSELHRIQQKISDGTGNFSTGGADAVHEALELGFDLHDTRCARKKIFCFCFSRHPTKQKSIRFAEVRRTSWQSATISLYHHRGLWNCALQKNFPGPVHGCILHNLQ